MLLSKVLLGLPILVSFSRIWVSLPGTAFSAVSGADMFIPLWFMYVGCPITDGVIIAKLIPNDSAKHTATNVNLFIFLEQI